jgi:proline iminopeptidase
MPRLSDPAHWHIVTMDQRGAGRSRPHAGDDAAALNANTTAHLVTDIERLRRQLGIAGWTVYGATWGTTLAQAYAHQHCEHVKGMILASVTTASRSERDFLYGGAGDFLPEAVDAFAAGAPDGRPGLGMTEAYAPRLTCGITEVEQAAALAWCRWENGVLQLDPRAEPTGAFEDPRFRLGFARLVTHYFRDLAWLESPLLDRAGALAGLPATLINSRLDLSCPPSTAWRLHQAWPRSELILLPGSLNGTLYWPRAEAIVAAGVHHADRLTQGQSTRASE